MHRFKETGFIVPDKISSWEKKEQIKKAENAKKSKKQTENGEEAPKVEIKKEKFKGGLVFDPDKGLWDRYILVMDYNSLYPSIIQEFDIDFATIDWTADDVSISSRCWSSQTIPLTMFLPPRRLKILTRCPIEDLAKESLKVFFLNLLLRSSLAERSSRV